MQFIEDFNQADLFLMEGALGERLKREYNIEINGTVAMASLVYSKEGRNALSAIWKEYMNIANKYNLPFLATTPTRRCNQERVYKSNYPDSIIADNIKFLKEVVGDSKRMYVGGLMGCRGDAYTGQDALMSEEAYRFHSWQAQKFKSAGVDFLYAGIMPTLPEALGMARAMDDTGIPYIISFTIGKDGCLIDGTPIHDGIDIIDNLTSHHPLCYMTNCVHPLIVNDALAKDFNNNNLVRKRFLGIQANTAALSYAEMDGNDILLATSTPSELATDMRLLKDRYGLRIFGGCCGTDNIYMEEIARIITDL